MLHHLAPLKSEGCFDLGKRKIPKDLDSMSSALVYAYVNTQKVKNYFELN